MYAAIARGQLDRLVVDSVSNAPPQSQAETLEAVIETLSTFAKATVILPNGETQSSDWYPGKYMPPKYWADPLSVVPDSTVDFQAQDFAPLQPSHGASHSTFSQATRIIIPSISVDAPTSELGIVNLGDSRTYETPDHVVGHIPSTAHPGEVGNGWYFGHLESPLRGEGDVFHRLPEIPNSLRTGDEIPILLLTGDKEYLYRVIGTNVVPANDLYLYDATDSIITLVSCVPHLVYDHRLLVTAEALGVRSLTPS